MKSCDYNKLPIDKHFIDVAVGRIKAKLVLKHAQVINVYTGEIESGDIAIENGIIVGVGNYSGHQEIDLQNKYVAPGFIDTHLHIESTMLTPAEFLKTTIPHGTTTFICDPHEIANVCGLNGINFMIEEAASSPATVLFAFSPCVPITPLEDSGYILSAQEVINNINQDKFYGLGEFMDYIGVINADAECLAKINACRFANKIIDGHTMQTGNELCAYVGAGIKTNHECVNSLEMLECIRRGMYVQIREGSATRNLEELVKHLTPRNIRRCVLCTDDRTVHDLLTVGHIDKNINLGIRAGVNPIDMLTMASLNAAECYKLDDRGAIAPGLRADLVVFDNLNVIKVDMVFIKGELVARDNQALFTMQPVINSTVLNTMNFNDLTPEKLAIPLKTTSVKVMKLLPKNVLTENLVRTVTVKNGVFVFDKPDILKVAVVERHHNTGRVGLGLIEGYGLKNGAVAITVAHDSHNVIAIGDSDNDMIIAINHLKVIKGGIVLVSNGKIILEFSLEIAGLMTQKSIHVVNDSLSKMTELAHAMGVAPDIEPFMSLSFLSLSVIPSLKITTRGLFDVEAFKLTDVDA